MPIQASRNPTAFDVAMSSRSGPNDRYGAQSDRFPSNVIEVNGIGDITNAVREPPAATACLQCIVRHHVHRRAADCRIISVEE